MYGRLCHWIQYTKWVGWDKNSAIGQVCTVTGYHSEPSSSFLNDLPVHSHLPQTRADTPPDEPMFRHDVVFLTRCRSIHERHNHLSRICTHHNIRYRCLKAGTAAPRPLVRLKSQDRSTGPTERAEIARSTPDDPDPLFLSKVQARGTARNGAARRPERNPCRQR